MKWRKQANETSPSNVRADDGSKHMSYRERALAKRLANGDKPEKPRLQKACWAKSNGCSAKHDGVAIAKPCMICGTETYFRACVLAWDAPCCLDHELGNYKFSVGLRWTKAGAIPHFTATSRWPT